MPWHSGDNPLSSGISAEKRRKADAIVDVTIARDSEASTAALGHELTSRHIRVMSTIPLKADQRGLHVRYVPLAGIQSMVLSHYRGDEDTGLLNEAL
ncbi:MAG: hypothetical protein WBE89_16500 [Methyloceanibacter sp.]